MFRQTDLVPPRERRSLQTHGLQSQVYVPILRAIFEEKYREGDTAVHFNLDDVRAAAAKLGITVRNPADVVYRMRSRTILPAEILTLGFYILRQVGRGSYSLEQASSTIIDLPDTEQTEALDLTPLPVRRLLPESLRDVDEQALLTVVGYCKLLDHFTGLTVYRLRSHVRKSVAGIGQAELDELDVGVAIRDDEVPIVIPVEAKAVADPVNRVQISVIGASTELISTMDAEHDIVADALAAEHTAMTRLKSSASSTEAKAAKVAMTRLQQVAVSHFEHEETEMEPISSAHRDAPEVHEIAKRFGKRLTPAKGGRFIAWVLDGASAEGRAAVTRDIPGPVVKIIGGIFGMPYRRNIAPIWRA